MGNSSSSVDKSTSQIASATDKSTSPIASATNKSTSPIAGIISESIDKLDIKQLIIDAERCRHDQKINENLIMRMTEYFHKYCKTIEIDLIDWIMIEAKNNNSTAQNRLGFMYYYGYGVHQDYKLAYEWFFKSADQGNTTSQCNLGIMYQNGHNVHQDYKMSCKLYQKSADKGNAIAQSSLGIMYQYGYGVHRDYKLACEWYQKSADQGNAIAQINLGVMYQNGYGVDLNTEKAYQYFKSSMEQGNSDASAYIINLIRNDPKNISQMISCMGEKVKKLETESEKDKRELEELRITVPIEGGPEYQEAMRRFNTHINGKKIF